jgi:hypothetical protein
MRYLLIAGTLMGSLCHPAWADMPVIDAAAIFRWGQQAKQMQEQLVQAENTVHSLTNVPQNLVGQVEGLLQGAVRNPLGNITQNIGVMLNGRGTGTCAGAQDYLAQSQYEGATGGDFTAQWLNQSANRNAGLQACTQQMMSATQARLDEMPALLDEVQSAQSVTEVDAANARISQEIATINAQQQQAMLMAQTAMLQRMTMDDQAMQKQRADAAEMINATSAGNASEVPAPTPFGGVVASTGTGMLGSPTSVFGN